MLDPHAPLTLEEAAKSIFRIKPESLRNAMPSLIAQGLPCAKVGKHYLFYPLDVHAFFVHQYYTADARRALRHGGSYVSTQGEWQSSGAVVLQAPDDTSQGIERNNGPKNSGADIC